MRWFLMKATAATIVLVATALVATYAYLRRSLPLVDGTVNLTGISASIDIIRDRDAIPHIFASTKQDALFGLGYVHAQDRLWQMEFQRRIGHGRLSEILGPPTLTQDRFLRTVGFGRAARAAWAKMPESARRDINAYVKGVNAFLDGHHGSALPPEFRLLRFEPEPWSGEDVVVWVKMMAWDLSANYLFELLRHDLAARVGPQRMAQLMPPYPEEGLSILTDGDLRRMRLSEPHGAERTHTPAGTQTQKSRPTEGDGTAAAFMSALSVGNPAVGELLAGQATSETLGSNNWVVDGTLTASGKPLLANDPHLGTKLPSAWYLAHLSAGDFDVIGATLPGAPAVALGRNRHIAWAATNLAADVEDLYRERLDESRRSAEFRGIQEPLQVVSEVINVKGQAPLRVDVRISRHGPIVSDAIDAINAHTAELRRMPKPAPLEPLSFRWTALDADDTTLVSFLWLNEARNWDDFTAALRWFVVPSQNFVYADADGHIGYYAPGRIPIRAHGDGSLPTEGWSGEGDWIGWIPFDELPHAYDPPQHFIVTANHRPVPATYPYFLGLDWPEPYRGQRITDLLGQKTSFTPDDFAAMQADTLSLHANALLPLLLAGVHPQTAGDDQALGILRRWNRAADGDSGAAAIFQAWFLRLTPTIAGDELGPALTSVYQGRFTYVSRFIVNTLTARDAAWCDDMRTPVHETCDEAVSTALHEAVADLTRQLGGDLTRWRWEDVHRAVFPHQGLDTIAALRPLLSRSVPSAGDWSTVNAGPVAADRPFEQRNVPSYRQVIDLSARNDSRFIDAVGQSGHPLSVHYDDFLRDWRAVRHRPMRMERADVERGAMGRLRLTPKQNQPVGSRRSGSTIS